MASLSKVITALDWSRGAEGAEWSATTWATVWGVLTAREQQVVFHHLVEGRALTEVAALLGVGRGAVDGAWRRALARIRDVIPAPG